MNRLRINTGLICVYPCLSVAESIRVHPWQPKAVAGPTRTAGRPADRSAWPGAPAPGQTGRPRRSTRPRLLRVRADPWCSRRTGALRVAAAPKPPVTPAPLRAPHRKAHTTPAPVTTGASTGGTKAGSAPIETGKPRRRTPAGTASGTGTATGTEPGTGTGTGRPGRRVRPKAAARLEKPKRRAPKRAVAQALKAPRGPAAPAKRAALVPVQAKAQKLSRINISSKKKNNCPTFEVDGQS